MNSFAVFASPHVQVEPFQQFFAHLADARVGRFGSVEFVLDPIDFLRIPEIFDELLIVGVVILLFEGGKLLESLDEQPLALQVGKSERAHDLFHALALRPRFHRAEEGVCDLLIVDAVEPRKADAFLLPFFIALAVQNARDPPDGFFAAVCKVVHRFRVVVIVVVGAEDLHFVGIEGRNEIGVVLIESERKLHKRPALFARFYFLNFDHVILSCDKL